jgi:hypothetical protein
MRRKGKCRITALSYRTTCSQYEFFRWNTDSAVSLPHRPTPANTYSEVTDSSYNTSEYLITGQGGNDLMQWRNADKRKTIGRGCSSVWPVPPELPFRSRTIVTRVWTRQEFSLQGMPKPVPGYNVSLAYMALFTVLRAPSLTTRQLHSWKTVLWKDRVT